MKLTSIFTMSFLLLGYVQASPAAIPEKTLAKRLTQPVCQVSDASPDAGDVQSCIDYLRGLPNDQMCVIAPCPGASNDFPEIVRFCNAGTAAFGGLAYPQSYEVCGCNPLGLNCHKAADYFQTLHDVCQSNGKVGGYQTINGFDIQGCWGYITGGIDINIYHT